MALIVLSLTLVGILILGFMVMKYYWGERGTPPPTKEARRLMREQELRLKTERLAKKEKQ
jgi:hypothetical protein